MFRMTFEKITRLAWIAMVLIVLGLASAAVLPYVTQRQIFYKFGDFASEESIAQIAAEAAKAEAPVLVGVFLLSLAGGVSAFGLFRCREWARKGWLAVCMMWVSGPVISNLPHGEMPNWPALVFRAVVLIYSWRVLMDPGVRGEFNRVKTHVQV